MQAEYFALEGISELMDTAARIRDSFNPALQIEGVVLTMFDERTNLAQQVARELRNFFGPRVLTTTIPRNVRLAEAPSHGKPALMYDVRSRGAESYIRLSKEILEAEVKRRQQAESPVLEESQAAEALEQPAAGLESPGIEPAEKTLVHAQTVAESALPNELAESEAAPESVGIPPSADVGHLPPANAEAAIADHGD